MKKNWMELMIETIIMKIGDWTLTPLVTGKFALDGGAMFGVVPKPLWSKTNPADDMNRITMVVRSLLIQNDQRRILVDVGLPFDTDEKFDKIYAVDHRDYTMEKALKSVDLSPEDITDVITTHLHFDHAGGLSKLEGKERVPYFPQAQIHVQKEHWKHALNPTERDRASFVIDTYRFLEGSGRLNLIDGAGELFPGIHLQLVNGHTPFQQMVQITGEGGTVLYAADLIPTASHIPLPYIMGYDLNPLKTLEEKKAVLPRAVEEGWTLVFEHDPFRGTGKVARDEKGFHVV
jgi:glyoxylase-like metal-dependent hydrolase (beta-lactamase superfamily II)